MPRTFAPIALLLCVATAHAQPARPPVSDAAIAARVTAGLLLGGAALVAIGAPVSDGMSESLGRATYEAECGILEGISHGFGGTGMCAPFVHDTSVRDAFLVGAAIAAGLGVLILVPAVCVQPTWPLVAMELRLGPGLALASARVPF